MKSLILGALLLAAQFVIAQQQGPPYETAPNTTPPTFPRDQTPDEPLPPDTKAPSHEQLSNPELRQQIDDSFSAEPKLADSRLNASVDDEAVTLTGTVDNEEQHDLAISIARSHAGDREIVDKIQIQGRT
jgi:hypothetical protein